MKKRIKKLWNNYCSPTPIHFRKLGDGFLYGSWILSCITIIEQLQWISIILLVIGIGMKSWASLHTTKKKKNVKKK